MAEKTKEYSTEELTVVWKPELCIHTEKCVHGLPKVFLPKDKPWIKPDQATTEQLINQVNECPSGALSFYIKGEESKISTITNETKIEVISNGPLIVIGPMEVKMADGTCEIKEVRASFCRCGHSANKPYCDGKHKTSDFVG